MSTRSIITAKRADGTYIAAYCHFDGYPSGVGKTLLEHWTAQDRIEELLSHGDMSTLAERCDKPDGHSFDSRVKGCTVYYGRDRGEDGTEPKIGATLAEVKYDAGQDYEYFWDGERWNFSGRRGVMEPLTAAVVNDET